MRRKKTKTEKKKRRKKRSDQVSVYPFRAILILSLFVKLNKTAQTKIRKKKPSGGKSEQDEDPDSTLFLTCVMR